MKVQSKTITLEPAKVAAITEVKIIHTYDSPVNGVLIVDMPNNVKLTFTGADYEAACAAWVTDEGLEQFIISKYNLVVA